MTDPTPPQPADATIRGLIEKWQDVLKNHDGLATSARTREFLRDLYSLLVGSPVPLQGETKALEQMLVCDIWGAIPLDKRARMMSDGITLDPILLAIRNAQPSPVSTELLTRIEQALVEIAKGEGAFSLDRFTHACNTIDSMKQIANEALRDLHASLTAHVARHER